MKKRTVEVLRLVLEKLPAIITATAALITSIATFGDKIA